MTANDPFVPVLRARSGHEPDTDPRTSGRAGLPRKELALATLRGLPLIALDAAQI
jgi:hypothetical protein